MNSASWLVGDKTHALDFVNKYWESGEHELGAFLPYIKRNDIFLSEKECIALKELTYLNDDHPFGKVDMNCTVGMVATDPRYVSDFRTAIEDALSLVKLSSSLMSLAEKTIKCFVPLTQVNDQKPLRENGSGTSVQWLKGAVFLSLPQRSPVARIELALNIVHELGHQILMVYQDADPILKDLDLPVYSAVRRTDRPAIMSFHGLIAVYFMLYFLNDLLVGFDWSSDDLSYLKGRYLAMRSDFVGGVSSVKKISFSDFGLLLTQEMVDFGLKLWEPT